MRQKSISKESFKLGYVNVEHGRQLLLISHIGLLVKKCCKSKIVFEMLGFTLNYQSSMNLGICDVI